MSKKQKDRGNKRSTKYNGQRSTVELEELRGYYFTHGDPGSGNKFNKTVEKIADYCRVKVSKEIYKLVLYGEEADFPEVEEPSGSKPSSAKMKKFEMDYKRRLEKQETYMKEKCMAFGIIMGQCLQMTKEVVKTDKSFKKLEEEDDVKGLLGLLRDLCYGTDKKRYVRWIQQAQLRKAITLKQEPTESIQRFATNLNRSRRLRQLVGLWYQLEM